MSLADPVSRDNEPAEEVGEVDFQNRKIAAYLMYAAAIFSVASIFVEGWLTSHWNLNFSILLFWLCGRFLKQGTRSAVSAVNWSVVIAATVLLISTSSIYSATFAPYQIKFREFAITPLITQIVLGLGIAGTVWSVATLYFLFKIRRHEKISSSDWVDWKTVVFVIGILILIFSIIRGLMYLEYPRTETELSDEIPITNTEAEQIAILKSRYQRQLERMKELSVAQTKHPEKLGTHFTDEDRKLFGEQSGIIKAALQSLDRSTMTYEKFIVGKYSLGPTSDHSIDHGYRQGTNSIDSKRYSTLWYGTHFQNQNGVWLGIELTVRQDHLQDQDIR